MCDKDNFLSTLPGLSYRPGLKQPCHSQKALGMPVEGAEKADGEGHVYESGLQRRFFTSEPRISLPQGREDADSLCGLIGRPDKLTEEKLTEDC